MGVVPKDNRSYRFIETPPYRFFGNLGRGDMCASGNNADLCSVLHRQLSPIRPTMMWVVLTGSPAW